MISVVISAVIVAGILFPTILATNAPQTSNGTYAGSVASPFGGLFGGASVTPSPVYVGNNDQLQTVPATQVTGDTNGRVVATSESLVGYVKHGGAFENVTGLMLSDLNAAGGYVNSSNLMYNGTSWFGAWLVNVPPTNATNFLFATSNLINQNGNTTSIDIQTQDVTNQTGGNQSRVPYSPFSIMLQELSGTTSNVAQPPPYSGLLGAVLAILGLVLDGTVYILAIAVPTFLIVLGGVLISRRVLYPILLRASGKSSSHAPAAAQE